MLRFEKGNIVTGDYPIFCHQVNCKGVMGAGLAKQIRSEYPIIYEEYKEYCKIKDNKLGTNFYTSTLCGRICVNMFAQDGYGKDKRYTNYDAFKACLDDLAERLSYRFPNMPVAFPYGIGCGLAGGDWYIILGMLTDFSRKIKGDVVIVSLN